MIISKATNDEKYTVFFNSEDGLDFLKEAFGFSTKYRECYLVSFENRKVTIQVAPPEEY